MVAEDFVTSKRVGWERLDSLLQRIRRGRLRSLDADEVYELGRLYRQATSDLAVARRDWPTHPVVQYLNGLVGRAHGEIYRNEATTWSRIRDFVLVRFPQVWRQSSIFMLVGFLSFALPALVSFVVSYRDPSQASLLFPAADSIVGDIKAHHEWWRDINEQGRGSSATLIMSNNILVSIKAFAGGVLSGPVCPVSDDLQRSDARHDRRSQPVLWLCRAAVGFYRAACTDRTERDLLLRWCGLADGLCADPSGIADALAQPCAKPPSVPW